jgi:hypothetical protein
LSSRSEFESVEEVSGRNKSVLSLMIAIHALLVLLKKEHAEVQKKRRGA